MCEDCARERAARLAAEHATENHVAFALRTVEAEAALAKEIAAREAAERERDVLLRVRERVRISERGCWEWMGPRTHQGYARIYDSGKTRVGHRLVWAVCNGSVDTNALVCHRCDNPPCVNPAHLFIGSPRDNMLDMVRKGRDRGVSLRCRSKKTCIRGHELGGENLLIRRDGSRRCRECQRVRRAGGAA